MLSIFKTQAALFAFVSVLAVLAKLLPPNRVGEVIDDFTLRIRFALVAMAGILVPLLYAFQGAGGLPTRLLPLLTGLVLVALTWFHHGAIHRAPLPWYEVFIAMGGAALAPMRFSARPFADFLLRAGLIFVVYSPVRAILILRYPASRPARALREIEALMRLSRSQFRILFIGLAACALYAYSAAPPGLANKIFAVLATGPFVMVVTLHALFRYGQGFVVWWADLMDPLFDRFIVDLSLAAAAFLDRTFRIATGLHIDLLNTKANTYAKASDYRKALIFAEASYNAWIRASRPTTLWCLQAVNGLAGFLGNAGNMDRAEAVLREGIAAFRAKPNQRANPEYGQMLSTLGKVLLRKGRIDEAEAHCREGLDVLRTHLGYGRMETLSALASLQICLTEKGEIGELDEEQLDYLGAAFEKPLVRRQFAGLAGWYYHSLGASYLRKGLYTQARRMFLHELITERKAIGRRSVGLTSAYLQLAITATAQSRPHKALMWLRRLVASEEHQTTAIFAVSDESQRLTYVRRFVVPVSISIALALRHEAALGDRGRVQAFLHAIRRKGLVAEAMLWQEQLRSDRIDNEMQSALEEWHSIRKAMAGGHEIPENAIHRERELAGRIEERFPDLRLEDRLRRIDWSSFEAVLPDDTTLIEFVRVNAVRFETEGSGGEIFGPARYVAFFVTKGTAPRLLDLGPAGPINLAVSRRIRSVSGLELHTSASDEVWRLIGAPIAAMTPARSRLTIAPDGELNRFPFEILRDPDDEDSPYFLTRYEISYVNCGRDLMRHTRQSGKAGEWRPPLFVAVRQFQTTTGAAVPEEPAESRSAPSPAQFRANRVTFPPLHGAAREVESIHSQWGGVALFDGDVTSARLRHELGSGDTNAFGPRILHFTTHGWVMGENTAEPKRLNALRRVGLALYGAQTFLETDADSQTACAGHFTGLDVLACNLRGTELVVLSCCSTGLGDLSYSEGVLGLQRAFLLSGAAAVVMSLWNVDDAATCWLMTMFYENLSRGKSRARALNEAKRRLSKSFSDPKYWGCFILQGNGNSFPDEMPRPVPSRVPRAAAAA